MSKTRYVLPVSCLPTRAPLVGSVVAYMGLDLYHAPGWAWGVVGTVYAVVWIGWACLFWEQKAKPLPGYGDTK